MRFLIISDLHGSAEAFSEAIEAYKAEHADYFLICGDYLYHGPRNTLPIGYEPKDLAPLLNEYRDVIIGIRGNCDSEVDQMLLDFPIMGDYAIVFNASRRCFLTHGHIYNENRLPPLSKGDVFISGHTHIPLLKQQDGLFFVNPGSTTIPKSLSKPGYAVMDDKHIELKTLSGHETIKSIDLSLS
ncbi:MAG: phosphodiesterase [Victivallales bacterium]|nr:phosphodiesterase [Victivallales bacterium]